MAACLHIGWPKTGTTHIQEWLKLNRSVLGRASLSAISSAASHRLGVQSLSDPLSSRSDIANIRTASSLDRAIAEVRADADACAIVSSEYFSLNDPERTAEVCAGAGIFVTQIICYLRRQDRLCASGYAQEVKTLGTSRRVDEVLYDELLNWEVLYVNWRRAFPESNLIFLNYDQVARDDRLTASFQNAVGAAHLATAMPPEEHNRSLGAEMVEVARLLNERGQTFDPGRLEHIRGWYPGLAFGFSQEITELFEQRFIEPNARFAARFPGEFDEFARPGWASPGIDMTGQIGEDHLADIVSYL